MANEFNLLGDNSRMIQRLLTEGDSITSEYMREGA